MTIRNLSTILFLSLIAGCAAEPPSGGGNANGNGNGNGNGDGNGNGNGNEGDPAGGGATAADVIELIATTECDQAHTCKASFPTDFGGTFAEVFGNSTQECYPLNAEYWNAAAVEAGIAGGTIMFDQAAADACMAGSITAPACPAFWMSGPGVPDACWDAFIGTVASGGACQVSFECSGELFCGEAGTCTTAP